MAVKSSTTFSSHASSAAGGPPGVAFTLYAVRDRVYASNVKHKLIDLGRLAQDVDGTYSYLLDGDKAAGGGFEAPGAALDHIAGTISFLFLDGQFTALEDLGGADRPDLQGVPQCTVTLAPLGRGERMRDARG